MGVAISCKPHENYCNTFLSTELERQRALEEAKQAELARIAAEEAELERQLELEQQAGKLSQLNTFHLYSLQIERLIDFHLKSIKKSDLVGNLFRRN